MYAVIKSGGKQQKVQAGDVIEVEKIVHEGQTITFQPLLVVDDDGATHVGAEAAKASVTAKPLGEKKGDKVRIFKYRPKSGYAHRGGHRQLLTLLEIESVTLGSAEKKTTPAKKTAATKATAAKKTTAAKKAAASEPVTPEPDTDEPESSASEAGEV